MADPKLRLDRDRRLDFFRGLALFFIFVDHIPGNILSNFTLQAVGFSDAAEVFIFISGYTAALVYGQAFVRQGAMVATARILHRVWQLYIAHIFLFVIFIATVSYMIQTTNNTLYSEELRIADFLSEPHVAIIRALTLQFQPTFLDILPLYIVLLLFFPLVLVALRRSPWLALGPSAALYAAAQVMDVNLPGYPDGRQWIFNPLAWQFLFVLGAASAYARLDGRDIRPRRAWPAVWIAAAIVAVAGVIQASWTIHWHYDEFPALLLGVLFPIDKTDLSPLRLVHFLALALLIGYAVRRDAPLLAWRGARPIILCGRHSLHIFCLGILLSVLGHFVLEELDGGLPLHLAVNVVGFAVMIGTAAWLDWFKDADRRVLLPVATVATPMSNAE